MPNPVFRENVVIVTGASSGIGREIVLQLAEQGAWLVLAARRADRLEAIAAACRGRGGLAMVVPADVSQEEQCQALIARTIQEYGRLDTLINNAGQTMWSPLEELQSLQPMEDVMRVNYFGSLYCTYYALPYLKQTSGRIVAVSSLAGKSGIPDRSGYAASKHAVTGFFDSLRIELEETGVSVTLVYPDYVATETRQRAYGPDGAPLGQSPIREEVAMSAETCARRIIRVAARREREEIMSLRGKIGLWVKLIAPGLIDRIARQATRDGR